MIVYRILTKWYTKSTSSGGYLHFNSEHHTTHKKNVIIAVIDRSTKLTSPKYRHETINKAKPLLLNNNYPSHLINDITKRRIHAFYNHTNRINTQTPASQIKYFSLPYVSNLSEKIGKIFQQHTIKIAH